MPQTTINRRDFFRMTGQVALAGACAGLAPAAASCAAAGPRQASPNRLPNIVLIFTDDQGYQDLGCFGSPDIRTPNIDRLRAGGMKFSDAYVAQPVCGASRAALLTGCYPNRIGLLGAPSHTAKHGIHADEMTIAQLVKQKDYATAMYGKWHLGHLPPFLPTRHGFDEYLGLPYSNDMWPYHPENPGGYPPLPLYENEEIVDKDVTHEDQTHLTTWYSERACKFITKNKDRPFFCYVAHNMPHVPLHVSEKYAGKSKRGLYGDVIMEIDWGVGRIVETLEEHGLTENTLVIFTSDNGPWLSYGTHAGCALPLREGKGTTWEGGVREPTVMRFAGRIPAGATCAEPIMTIDFLPTIAHLVGGRLPDHKIDGLNIWPLMEGRSGAACPHDAFFFYWGRALEAVRMDKWKLHFPHAYRTLAGREGGTGGTPVKYETGKTDLALYDLRADISESTNVAEKHPDVVKQIEVLADAARKDLGDSARKIQGEGLRPAGHV